MRLIPLIFSLFLFSFSLNAQEVKYPSIIHKQPTDVTKDPYLETQKQVVEKQLEKNPKDISALLNLGWILINLKEYDQAKSVYQKTLDIEDNYRAHLQLAYLFLWEGDLSKAKKEIAKAQEIAGCQLDVYKTMRSYAEILTENKEYEKALDVYGEMLLCQPNDPVINFYVGRLYSWEKNWNQAEFYLNKALSIDSDFYDAEFQLASVYYWSKRNFLAEETLQKLLQRYPCDRQSMELMDKIASSLGTKEGTFTETLRMYEQLSICYPQDPKYPYEMARIYVMDGDGPKAKEALQRSLEMDPLSENANVLLGEIYFKEGRLQDAKKHLQNFRQNRTAQRILGEIARVTRTDEYAPSLPEYSEEMQDVIQPETPVKLDEFPPIITSAPQIANTSPEILAKKIYAEKILENNPDDVMALLHMSNIYLQQKKVSDAEKLLQRIIEIDNNYRAHLQLAFIYLWRGQTELARANVKTVEDILPCHVDLYPAYEALAKRFTAKKDYEEALDIYETMLKCQPRDAQIYFKMGRIYSWERNWPRAEESLRNALSFDPNNFDYLFQLALVYSWQDNFERASDIFTQILQVETCNPRVLDRLERIGKRWRKNEERYRDCLEIYLQLVSCDPNNANYHYEIGRLYALQGQFQDAKSQLEESYRLDPNQVKAALVLGQIYLEEGQVDLAKAIFAAFPDNARAQEFLRIIAEREAKGDEAIVQGPLVFEDDFEPEQAIAESPDFVDPLLAPEDFLDGAPEPLARDFAYQEKPYLVNPYIESDKETYEEILKEEETTSPTLTRLAKLYILTGRLPEAENSLEKHVKKEPNDIDALVQLGFIYLWRDKVEHAYRTFIHVIELEPCQSDTLKGLEDLGYMWRYNRDKFDDVSKIYNILIECDVNPARHYFYLGRLNAWEHNWKRAEEQLKMAIELRPRYTDAQIQLMSLYIWMKRYDDAKQILEAENLKPYRAEHLGRIALSQKEYVKAEEYYKEAIRNDSKSSNAWRGLGNALKGRRMFREGEKALLESVAIDPQNQGSWIDLFRIKDYTTLNSGFRHSETVAVEDDPDFQKPVVETFYVNSEVPIEFAVTNRLNFELEPRWGYQKEKNLFNISLINYNVDLTAVTAKLKYFWSDSFSFGGFVRLKKGEQIGASVFPYKQQRRFERGANVSFQWGDHSLYSSIGYSSFLIKNFDIRMTQLLTLKSIVASYTGLIDTYPELRYGCIVRNSYYEDNLNNKEKARTVWFEFGIPYFEKNWFLEYEFEYRSFDKVSDNYWSFNRREANSIILKYINTFRNRTYAELSYKLGWNKSNGESVPVGLFIVESTVRRTRSHKFALDLEHRVKDTFLFNLAVSYGRSNYVYKSGSAKVGFVWKF